MLDIREPEELASLQYEDGKVSFGATDPEIWRKYLRDTVTHVGALTLGKAHRPMCESCGRMLLMKTCSCCGTR